AIPTLSLLPATHHLTLLISCSLMLPPPLFSPLFPYTTLFRSLLSTWPIKTLKMARRLVRWYSLRWSIECWHKVLKVVCASIQYRSEEHTSKLQSLRHLVCRLLLEKKKKKQNNTTETE